jgi:hypothetical protein
MFSLASSVTSRSEVCTAVGLHFHLLKSLAFTCGSLSCHLLLSHLQSRHPLKYIAVQCKHKVALFALLLCSHTPQHRNNFACIFEHTSTPNSKYLTIFGLRIAQIPINLSFIQ